MQPNEIVAAAVLSVATGANLSYFVSEMRAIASDMEAGRYIHGNAQHSLGHFGIMGMLCVASTVMLMSGNYGWNFAEHLLVNAIFHFGVYRHFAQERKEETR